MLEANFKKVVLFRPVNGLNDTLCGLEQCCHYAERTGRRVIVDTTFEKARVWRQPLSRFFVSKSCFVSFPDSSPTHLFNSSIYPEVLQSTGPTFDYEFDEEKRVFVEKLSRQSLNFDFRVDYRHDTLVFQTGGGGWDSLKALRRVRLRDEIVDAIEHCLACISADFVGVHVRNTDYVSNWEIVVRHLCDVGYTGHLLVCSDDPIIIEKFRDSFGESRVFNFTKYFNSSGSTPLHFVPDLHDKDLFIRNSQSIIDLLLLSLSRSLICAPLAVNSENPDGRAVSGFSELAKSLQRDRSLLSNLISRRGSIIDNYLGYWNHI